MQVENLTKEQFIRDSKDTPIMQLIKALSGHTMEIFTALAGLTVNITLTHGLNVTMLS